MNNQTGIYIYMCVCARAFMCVCSLLYEGTHVKLLIFYHKPVVVMKQLLFNLTRYACYLRRADMKKFEKVFLFCSFSYRLCIGTCFSSQLCITVCSAALWSYFTVRGYVSFNPSRLKAGTVLYTDIRAVNPPQNVPAVTGTFTFLILEQGQHGALTLCLVDKLKLRLYTVKPDSTWHLTAFKLHPQEYHASSSSLFLSNQ